MDICPIELKEKWRGGIENNSALLENGVKRIGVIGGSGSGKTTWLSKWWLNMIHKPIGGVTIVAKNQEQYQYDAIDRWCKKEKIPYQMLEEFTMDDMAKLREDDVPKVVIYDDLAGTDNMDALLGVAKYGRVKHIYLACIGQDYRSIPREVRQNLNEYVVFPLAAAHAARSMINGLGAFVDEENLKKAYRWICKPANKYSCVFIQLDGLSVLMDKEGNLWDLKNFQSVSIAPREKRGKDKKKLVAKDEENDEEEEDE